MRGARLTSSASELRAFLQLVDLGFPEMRFRKSRAVQADGFSSSEITIPRFITRLRGRAPTFSFRQCRRHSSRIPPCGSADAERVIARQRKRDHLVRSAVRG
jgi:hypothetical protein